MSKKCSFSECNSFTVNKFCSRSCAAKQNNVIFPKRKSMRVCQRCSTPVQTRVKYCSQRCRTAPLVTVSETVFREICAESIAYTDFAQKIFSLQNGSDGKPDIVFVKQVRRLATFFNVDTSHFLGQASNSVKALLVERMTVQEFVDLLEVSSSLKNYKEQLFSFGIKERKCERQGCELTEGFGSPAILELDHIDGDKTNNKLDNLRVLCLQCHAQTPTWRRRKSSLTPGAKAPWEMVP